MPRLSPGLRIFALFAGIGCFLLTGVGIAAMAKYKPWGVRDHDRPKYDQIMRDLQTRQAELKLAEKIPTPCVKVEQAFHDFGTIDPGDEYQYTFAIRNDGDAPLLLKTQEADCDCTSISLESPEVGPRESTTATVSWNVEPAEVDSRRHQVTLSTNDPRKPEITLTLAAKVNVKWGFSQLVMFNSEVSSGFDQPFVAKSVLYSQVYDEFVVVDTQSSTDDIEIDIEPVNAEHLIKLDAKSAVQVVARHAARPGLKRFEETIRLLVIDPVTGEENWMESPFNGKFKPPVGFYGPEVDIHSGYNLGTVESDSDKEWTIAARFWTSELPVEPAVLKLHPESLEAELEPLAKPAGGYKVTIRLKDDAKPEFFQMADKQGYIEVGDIANPEVSNWMPLRGQIIPPIRD